jgi:hypothetical protein
MIGEERMATWARRLLIGLGGLAVVGLAAVGLLTLGRPRVSFFPSDTALSDVQASGVGVHLGDVRATLDGRRIGISTVDGQLTPTSDLPAGATVDIEAAAIGPSWLRWLSGPTTPTSVVVHTPRPRPTTRFAVPTTHTPTSSGVVSSVSQHDVRVRFTSPVRSVAYRRGGPGSATHIVHVDPASTVVAIPVPSGVVGGTIALSGVARSWEIVPHMDHTVTWFAATAGSSAIVVADPGPGATAPTSTSPITLTFSTTVTQVLGTARPTLPAGVAGTWSEPTSHELVFTPSGFGYGPGASVTVGFDRPVRVVASGAASSAVPSAASSYTFAVAPGSVLRLDQLLAQLHYLPLRFTPAAGTPTPTTLAAEESTIYAPLAGSFSWRYGDVPAALAAQWSPGQATVMVKGASMAFEAAETTYAYCEEVQYLV